MQLYEFIYILHKRKKLRAKSTIYYWLNSTKLTSLCVLCVFFFFFFNGQLLVPLALLSCWTFVFMCHFILLPLVLPLFSNKWWWKKSQHGIEPVNAIVHSQHVLHRAKPAVGSIAAERYIYLLNIYIRSPYEYGHFVSLTLNQPINRSQHNLVRQCVTSGLQKR